MNSSQADIVIIGGGLAGLVTANRAAQLGLIKKEDVNLENYITRKGLDGLFTVVAEEEARIRANPIQETSNIIKKVFGAIKL